MKYGGFSDYKQRFSCSLLGFQDSPTTTAFKHPFCDIFKKTNWMKVDICILNREVPPQPPPEDLVLISTQLCDEKVTIT